MAHRKDRDPRIYALYFCPQLYQFDADRKLVPLRGEAMQARRAGGQGGVIEKRPWYEPSDTLPAEPIINVGMPEEFDTVVVEGARKWASVAE